jgi:hypothetical protein
MIKLNLMLIGQVDPFYEINPILPEFLTHFLKTVKRAVSEICRV